MKKIITSCLVLLFAINTFAQVKGSLTIYAKEGEKIWVIKNGVKQNKDATTSVTIKDITEKFFKIKVIVDDDAMSSVDKQIQMVDVDNKMCNITYELRKKKNVYGLSMISWEPIVAQSVTSSTTTATTVTPENKNTESEGFQQNTNMGETGVTQTTTTGQTQTNVNMGQNGANISINDPEMGVNLNVGMNVPVGQGVVTSSTTTTTTTSSTTTSGTNMTTKPVTTDGKMNPKPQPKPQPENPPKENYNNPNHGCYAAMPATDFSEGKAQVQKASFADDKLRIAKQLTQANCMSVAQIKEIAKLFSFEDNKLEYLKFAYDFTFEKNKYYLVNDLLSFSSSKEEMDNFLNSKK